MYFKLSKALIALTLFLTIMILQFCGETVVVTAGSVAAATNETGTTTITFDDMYYCDRTPVGDYYLSIGVIFERCHCLNAPEQNKHNGTRFANAWF